MFLQKAKLIPRANWDYGFKDLLKAWGSLLRSDQGDDTAFEEIFGLKPLFTNSGRTSLYAILKALKLPEGSYVGVPLFCCDVVFLAIAKAGLKPKFIDIGPDDYNISVEDLDKKKKDLAAVVVVHMFGHPADMDSINSVCPGLPVIEDCAHSLFSTYKGRYTGTLATTSFFSFRSGKYLSAGEGSAVLTKDEKLYQDLRHLLDGFVSTGAMGEVVHAGSTYIKSALYHRPWYGTVGLPLGKKLDKSLNLTAKSGFEAEAIARVDLGVIRGRINQYRPLIEKQRENALTIIRGLKIRSALPLFEGEGCRANYYQFPLKFKTVEQRDTAAEFLWSKGIDIAKYLDEIVKTTREYYDYPGDCPQAEEASKNVLLIPSYYTLSQTDLAYIISYLNKLDDVLKS